MLEGFSDRWRIHHIVCCLLIFLAFFSGDAVSGEVRFPIKHVKYKIFFDPGGQSDREARRQQPYLKMLLGQPVIIEYKVGGGGSAGWKEFSKKTRPDGYTVAGFNLPHIILQPMFRSVGYNTNDMEPIVLFQRAPLGLAVRADSPYKNLSDFIEAARKDPGKITVAGASIYSGSHFANLRLEKLSDAKTSYIPFTGSNPQTASFLGGHVEAAFLNSDDMTRVRDKIRVLAFATEERFEGFPDAPTFRELGFDLVVSVERGVCVPPYRRGRAHNPAGSDRSRHRDPQSHPVALYGDGARGPEARLRG